MGIRDGGAYSLMCAYNRVDGKPACASDMLLADILRDEWKFPGYIVRDCGAIDDIYRRHKYAATPPEAAAARREDRNGPRVLDHVAQLVTDVHAESRPTRSIRA